MRSAPSIHITYVPSSELGSGHTRNNQTPFKGQTNGCLSNYHHVLCPNCITMYGFFMKKTIVINIITLGRQRTKSSPIFAKLLQLVPRGTLSTLFEFLGYLYPFQRYLYPFQRYAIFCCCCYF